MKIASRSRSQNRFRPKLESLEPRLVPTIMYWDGAHGNNDWGDPVNWSNDVVPGPDDDAMLMPNTPACEIDGGAVCRSIGVYNSLTISGSVTLTGMLGIPNNLGFVHLADGASVKCWMVYDCGSVTVDDGASAEVDGDLRVCPGANLSVNTDKVFRVTGSFYNAGQVNFFGNPASSFVAVTGDYTQYAGGGLGVGATGTNFANCNFIMCNNANLAGYLNVSTRDRNNLPKPDTTLIPIRAGFIAGTFDETFWMIDTKVGGGSKSLYWLADYDDRTVVKLQMKGGQANLNLDPQGVYLAGTAVGGTSLGNFDGPYYDPMSNTAISVDWGDGTDPAAGYWDWENGGISTDDHTFAGPGTYTVTLKVADADDPTLFWTATVTIHVT